MGEKVGQIDKVPEVKKSSSNSRVRKTERLQSMDTPVNRILFLQRTAGNQAVQRLIKSGALQAKLRIGQPGDMYEQEADQVADSVMRMPEPGVQRQVEPEEEEERLQAKPLTNQIIPLVQVQRQEEPEEEEETLQAKPLAEEITPLVQRQVEPEEEEEEELQAKATSGHLSEVNSNLESDIQSLKGSGQPLSENDRAFFEPRFGHDFSQVWVHTDAQAAEAAQAMNAKAFTVGKDVVFGSGHNVSGTSEGRRLMAHELTHVVQQNGGPTLFSEGKNSMNTILNSQEFSVLSTGFIKQGTAKPGVSHDSADSIISSGSVDATSRRLIQRSFTPLAPGGGFRGLMERDRRRVHGRPSSTLPWIDVRSGPAASVGFGGHGFDHLFIIETDTSAREFFYRGGIRNRCAGTSWPFYGISTDSGPYLPGTVDWHPGAPSVNVATGAAAMGKGSCFNSQLARIRASCIPYGMLGPNSNTVVKTLLANCGLPLRKPDGSWAPGWGHATI